MKLRFVGAAIALLLSFSLAGCGSETTVAGGDESTSADTSEGMNESTSEGTEVSESGSMNESQEYESSTVTTGKRLKKTDPVVYDCGDTLPIIVGGKTVAFAKINQLERVGIADWYNTVASQKKIEFSYSLNLTIINEEDQVLSVGVTPTLLTKRNKIASSTCSVGWTGFGETAEFYKSGEVEVEVGFQPEIKKMKGCKLQLVFNTGEGDSEPVVVGHSIFSHVVKGPKLKSGGERIEVEDAGIACTVERVYCEPNMIDEVEKTVIEFDNVVESLWGTKSANLKIGMQTMNDSTLRYEHSEGAWRQDYFLQYTDEYASSLNKQVKKGGKVRLTLNRIVKSEEEAVRFWVEFPDEIDGLGLKEKLKFDGRFTVIQCNVQERKIKYEG